MIYIAGRPWCYLIGVRKKIISLVVALFWTTSGVAQTGNHVELTFKYKVLQGTCDLSVPSTIPMGDVSELSSAREKNWVYLNKSSLPITLSNCVGRGAGGTRPAIKLIAPPVATTGSGERTKKIFTSATNKTGLGIVLSDGMLTNGNSANLVTLSGVDGFVDLGGVNAVAHDQLKKLNVALACGTASDCSGANLQAGSGNVSIQFAFVYH